MDPFHKEGIGTLLFILHGIFHDWVPHAPLMAVSIILILLFPVISNNRRNALCLLAFLFLPIVGLYLFCKVLDVTHFITSRYFINFLPICFITLFLSLEAIENKFIKLNF